MFDTLATFPPPAPIVSSLALPQGIRLRGCRAADMGFLQRLYRQVRQAELAHTGWPEEMKRFFCEQQFSAQHTDYLRRFPQAQYLVISTRQGPIGRLYVDFPLTEDPGSHIHVIEISLLSNSRGRGLGTALLQMLQQQARHHQQQVSLNVDKRNHQAAQLYQRLGFSITETGATHHTMIWSAH